MKRQKISRAWRVRKKQFNCCSVLVTKLTKTFQITQSKINKYIIYPLTWTCMVIKVIDQEQVLSFFNEQIILLRGKMYHDCNREYREWSAGMSYPIASLLLNLWKTNGQSFIAFPMSEKYFSHPFFSKWGRVEKAVVDCAPRELTCLASGSWLVGTLPRGSGWKEFIHSINVSIHYEHQLPLYGSYFVSSTGPILIHWHLITTLWPSTYYYDIHFACEETEALKG